MQKRVILLLTSCLIGQAAFSQYTHRIKADSVLLTNDTTANELILENESRYTKGFLYNRGKGRTEFRRGVIQLNDSIFLVGNDSIRIPSRAFGPNWWKVNGNTGINAGIHQLGTSDSTHFVFRTYNLERIRITANGNLLLGTAVNSIFKLDVAGLTRITEDSYINGLRIGKGAGNQAQNTVLGANALQSNTTGIYNTAIGYNALNANTSGRINTAVGAFSMADNTTGENNTAVGGYTLAANTGGSNNVALGYRALFSNTTAYNNTAIGYYSLDANTTGNQNTTIGYRTLSSNTTGFGNTAVGYLALALNTTGAGNNAFGENALGNNTTGSNNVALGASALQSTTTSIENVAIGNFSLQDNTTGSSNTSAGFEALDANTTSGFNTSLGALALHNNSSGVNNTAVGYASLRYNDTGNDNFSAGAGAMLSNTSGSINSALGNDALSANTTGSENTANGRNALESNIAGAGNIAMGVNSLLLQTSGDNNVAVGQDAGSTLTTGSNNIFIGYNTQPNIGNTSSDQLNIGNWIYGNAGFIGIGVLSPTAKLHLEEGESGSNLAPVKFASGTLMTTPENGAVEYNGSNFHVTAGGERYVLAKTLSETATLDFTSTSAGNSNDLTITLTGASEGDPVIIVPPGAAQLSNSSYSAYVSSANTVTVRFNNYSSGALDPDGGNFRVVLFKY